MMSEVALIAGITDQDRNFLAESLFLLRLNLLSTDMLSESNYAALRK
jgi:GDP-D-mannose dehydratase